MVVWRLEFGFCTFNFRMLEFVCVNVRFLLCGRCILFGWTSNFGFVYDGLRLGGCWILVAWNLDFYLVDVGFGLYGC